MVAVRSSLLYANHKSARDQLLREMEASGLDVCGRSFTLAMSACLGANRDWTGVELDLEADRELPEVALSLFDRLVEAGVTPTTLTYALALKVRRHGVSVFHL